MTPGTLVRVPGIGQGQTHGQPEQTDGGGRVMMGVRRGHGCATGSGAQQRLDFIPLPRICNFIIGMTPHQG